MKDIVLTWGDDDVFCYKSKAVPQVGEKVTAIATDYDKDTRVIAVSGRVVNVEHKIEKIAQYDEDIIRVYVTISPEEGSDGPEDEDTFI